VRHQRVIKTIFINFFIVIITAIGIGTVAINGDTILIIIKIIIVLFFVCFRAAKRKYE
jgi:hypothetical protein